MDNFFPDNFVDYDDPPIDSNSLTPDTRDFSLQSPHSDSTGQFLSSHSPESYHNYAFTEQQNFDLMGFHNQQHEVHVQVDNLESSKRGSRKKKNVVVTPTYTEDSTENSSEGKILDKSKRIQKRTVAKERTKQKQDLTSLFAGVDAKFLPEGYDDPNLDERAKKKMIQMVRNRISAQNSRDRKKENMQQLQETNSRLEAQLAEVMVERDEIAAQLQQAQEEIQMLKNNGGNGLCHNCATKVEDEAQFIVSGNDHDQENPEIPMGGFSGLSSPRLVRFASSRGGFLGMFAFLGIIAMIAVVNMGPAQEPFGLQTQGLNTFERVRHLEVVPGGEASLPKSVLKESPSYVTQVIPDYSNSLVLQNIDSMMAQFQKSYEPTFKSYLQNSAIINGMNLQEIKNPETIEVIPLENKDYKTGVVQYDSVRASNNLRKTSPPVIINTPPAVTDPSAHTSTLFCSSGHEFYDNGTQNVHVSEKSTIAKNTTLDLEKADYLQLFVPKGTIVRSNSKHKITDIYGQDIYNDDLSDDTMLEIWCKVFLVREIGPSY